MYLSPKSVVNLSLFVSQRFSASNAIKTTLTNTAVLDGGSNATAYRLGCKFDVAINGLCAVDQPIQFLPMKVVLFCSFNKNGIH